MPFFASLPPILSSSALHPLLPSPLPPFDLPLPTLSSLSRTLRSLKGPSFPTPDHPPRASLISQTLFHLACHCPWDDGLDPEDNAVFILSPLPRTPESAREFLGDGKAGALSVEDVFGAVKRRFASKGVRVCWVDVNFDGENGARDVVEGISRLGWAVCTAEEIALGVKVIPFGMVFGRIWGDGGGEKKGRADVVLKIADVGGEPLECRCCTVEVFDAGPKRGQLPGSDIWGPLSCGGGGNVTISVMAVEKIDRLEGVLGSTCGSVVLRGVLVEKGRSGMENGHSGEAFFGSMVLELLCRERQDLVPEKPLWQLILVFLYRRNLCALVSLVGDGAKAPLVGMIRPVSVNSAVLSIYDAAGNDVKFMGPVAARVPGNEILDDINQNRKSEKRKLRKLCNLSWSAFRTMMLSAPDSGGLDIELEDVYLAKERDGLKKLRFLQCWMKQMKRSSTCLQVKLEEDNALPDKQEGTEDGSWQEKETPISSSSAWETEISQPVNEEKSVEEPLSRKCVVDLESLARSLPEKIEHGLCSKDVDLGDLAERLVELATRATYLSFQKSMEEYQGVESTSTDGHILKVVSEVSRVLLVKPKELAAKYRGASSSAPTPSAGSDVCAKKVREHELQILFRMEILRSNIGVSIDESSKAKMVKDICSLLENIEFNLQVNVFSGESLIDFTERIIKTRYILSLGDVIHRIYSQMEFLPFNEGDEDSVSTPKSHHDDETHLDKLDSHASSNAMAGEQGVAVLKNGNFLSAKTSYVDSSNVQQRASDRIVDHQLAKAFEERERARRLSHFTSRLQNLQRVWAPKHNKTVTVEHGHSSYMVERRRRRHSRNDMVLETPMSGKKHRHVRGTDSTEEEVEQATRSSLISKALFNEEFDQD